MYNFREYDDYEISSEEWHYHYIRINYILFDKETKMYFCFISFLSFFVLSILLKTHNKPSPKKYILVSRHILNI